MKNALVVQEKNIKSVVYRRLRRPETLTTAEVRGLLEGKGERVPER